MRHLRDNGLSIFFGVLFLAALAGQSIAGHSAFNQHQLEHDAAPVSYWRYLTSSEFGQAMLENWQSEYLQFTLFILATVWLVQRGSGESKQPGKRGRETEREQKLGPHAHSSSPRWARLHGGFRRALYSNSLLIVMGLIFVLSWFGQSVTGMTAHNADQRLHGEPSVSWARYLMEPDFWENTLQNWQSEFLAVGTMAVFTIFLRQRGSPESKPVGAAHDATGGAD
jgi:hypothetical protein